MKHLLLLHGAIGAMDQLQPLALVLDKQFNIHRINFSGHGNQQNFTSKFSMELFETDVLQYLQRNEIEKVAIFGYSMGGYVAMYLAKKYPDIVTNVITLATKFNWNPTIAANEVNQLNPEVIRQKLPQFVTQLEQRHGNENWEPLLIKTQQFLIGLGQNNLLNKTFFQTLNTRCLLITGDRDKMVGADETKQIFEWLPNASMAVLPSTPHPIERCNIALLAFIIHQFLNE